MFQMTTFCIAFYESYLSTRIYHRYDTGEVISTVMVTQVKMGARHNQDVQCIFSLVFACIEKMKSDPLSMVRNTTDE